MDKIQSKTSDSARRRGEYGEEKLHRNIDNEKTQKNQDLVAKFFQDPEGVATTPEEENILDWYQMVVFEGIQERREDIQKQLKEAVLGREGELPMRLVLKDILDGTDLFDDLIFEQRGFYGQLSIKKFPDVFIRGVRVKLEIIPLRRVGDFNLVDKIEDNYFSLKESDGRKKILQVKEIILNLPVDFQDELVNRYLQNIQKGELSPNVEEIIEEAVLNSYEGGSHHRDQTFSIPKDWKEEILRQIVN